MLIDFYRTKNRRWWVKEVDGTKILGYTNPQGRTAKHLPVEYNHYDKEKFDLTDKPIWEAIDQIGDLYK